MKFFYVDALAGMGKTTSAIKYAIKQAQNGHKVALVQPSTNLIDQTFRDLKALNANVSILRFHSECKTGPVKETVMGHLNNALATFGEIILITHQTLLTLPYWHNAQSWDVIVDEIPQIHTEWVRKLPSNHKTVTDHFQLGTEVDGYAAISIKAGSQQYMLGLAENQHGDEQHALYQDLASNLVMADRWETVVDVKSYSETMSGLNKGKNTLHTHSLLRPQQFAQYRSFTVMGAMFPESVMFKLWSKSVEFDVHDEISQGLKGTVHSNGPLLTIRYLYDSNWSKGLRDSTVDGRKVYGVVKDAVYDQMGNDLFIYAANNDDMKGLNSGIRLSTQSHGINSYQNIHKAAFMSALNSNNPSFSFMKASGITPGEVTEAQYLQSLYQFVMRTSLRDTRDQSAKTIVVMDARGAEYLSRYFPGCTLEKIEGVPAPEMKKLGRKPSGDAKTPAQRMKESRERKRALLQVSA